jgi:hypothetical protein
MRIPLKRILLSILLVLSVVCARTLLLLLNDPEGPNLLIVVVGGVMIYGVIYAFLRLAKIV